MSKSAKKATAKSAKKATAKSVTEVKLSNTKAAKLGHIMAEVGDAIGHAQLEVGAVEEMTIARVETLLRDAMANGLVCDDKVNMLKASTEKNPNPLYDAIVDGINAPRIAVGKEPISDGTRYNFTSRIRQFVRERGANPLDLYGHIADRKAKEERLANQKKEKELQAKVQEQTNVEDTEATEATETPQVPTQEEKPVAINARGLIALRDFLGAFIVQNDEPEVSPEMEFVLGAVDELMEAVKKVIAKKQEQGKAKGRKAKIPLVSIDQII